MANINLTSGERYTFGKLKGISVITDSTDNAEAPKYIRNTLNITSSNAQLNVLGSTGTSTINISTEASGDPTLRLSIGSSTPDNWTIGIDRSDAGSFKIQNSTVLSSGASLALRIDTDENISIPGNLDVTGSFSLSGIASTATAYGLYYNPTTKQVTYGASGSGGGGGGTPGGSDTQIQYNNAGGFGGVPTLTYDGSLLRATGSFTGSFRGVLTGTSSFATTASYALNAGTGTVNSGVANYLAYYDSTAASISDINQNGAGVKTNAIEYDGFQWGWGLMLVTSAGTTGSQISAGVNGQDSWLNTVGGTVGIGKNSSFANAKLDVSGSTVMTGSLNVTLGITGSLLGIASSGSAILIQNTPATTGTYYPVFVSNISGYGQARIDNSTYTYNPTTNTLTVTASYAETSSFINPLNQNATLSGSLQITGSLTVSGSSTFINIGPAEFSGSVSSLYGYTGSLHGTASVATSASIAATALIANATNFAISSSYTTIAATASYIANSITPSGGEGAVQFQYGAGIAGTNRFSFDSATNIVNINNGATLNATGSLLGTSSYARLTATASVASTALTTRVSTAGTYYPVFVDSSNGAPTAESLWTSTGNITMNPGSGSISATSITASLLGTSSYAILAATASYFSGSISNAISSSYALTASYALNGGGGGSGSGFPYTGNAVITGSLEVTNGITGSLSGTSSYADSAANAARVVTTGNTDDDRLYLTFVPLQTRVNEYDTQSLAVSEFIKVNPSTGIITANEFNGNADSATYATTAGATAFAGTSTLAYTASFVSALRQNVAITGSVTLGNITSTPSTEATLNVYPPMISGTGEGGQILLAASGGLYTSASMIDTYQNYLRILKGTNTGGSTNQLIALDLHTGNMTVAGIVSVGAWSAGQVIKDTILSNTDVTISTTTIATSTSDTDFLTYSYTPISSTSYLVIHYHLANYDFSAGTGNDSYISRIKVDGNEITYSTQSTVNGNRSGVLFPLTGRYTNSNTTAKSIVVACRRSSADDSITITNSATSMWLRITEIAR